MHVRLLLRWLRVLRNDTDAQHVVARRVYVRSVAWPLYFKSTEMRPGVYDLMLVPQTDYLKGLDCRVHTLHLLRTARLDDDWRSLIQRLSQSKTPQCAALPSVAPPAYARQHGSREHPERGCHPPPCAGAFSSGRVG